MNEKNKNKNKKKPVIGIVAKPLSDFECPDDLWIEDYVKDEFRDLVCRGGCLAAGILPPFQTKKYNEGESDLVFQDNLTDTEKEDLDTLIHMCDGIILQGGLSGDFYELYIAEAAIAGNIPIIGICAGFNTLARAAGSNIIAAEELGIPKEKHNVYSADYRHDIKAVKGSVLYEIFGTDTLSVNSLHTQFLEKRRAESPGSRLEINAEVTDLLKDGTPCTTVEAFTVRDTKFAMGVKWHPEIMDEKHKSKLFSRFLKACTKA